MIDRMMNYVIERSKLHSSGGRVNIWSAAYDKRGRLIAQAGNDYTRSHSVMSRLGKRVGNPERVCLHSEVLTILRSRGRIIDSLYIARTKRTGEIGLAKPCPSCQAYIEEVEVVQGRKINIYFTKGD